MVGHTVRADCEGGALSVDFGPLLLRGMDRQIGLIARLTAALRDHRPPSYSDHALRDLWAPRIYPMASSSADGDDAKSLRRDPMCQLERDRRPLEAAQAWASAATFSRLEHRVDRTDISRLPQAFVDHCIASDPEPPSAIALDLEHADDPTHGQQALALDNHSDRSDGDLPLCIFEGTSHALVMADLRPGTRPRGADNALILSRLLPALRRPWPETHLLVRGDSHLATPEVMEVVTQPPLTDFVFGLASNAVLLRHVAPLLPEARRWQQPQTALAQGHGTRPPTSRRL